MNKPVLFVYRKKKEYKKMSRAKNPKYESMSLEELKANMKRADRNWRQQFTTKTFWSSGRSVSVQ